MKVVKRDGKKVEFDAIKIENAILKAMKCGSGIVDEKCAHDIAVENEKWHEKKPHGKSGAANSRGMTAMDMTA